MQTQVTVSKDAPVVVGRHSGTSQVQVGKRKRYISRHHLKIEYNIASDQFECVVLGKQAIVHEHQKQTTEYDQHARFVVHDRDKIKIVDEIIVIHLPAPPAPPSTSTFPQENNEKKIPKVKQEAPHQLPPSPPQQDTNSPPPPQIKTETNIATVTTTTTNITAAAEAAPVSTSILASPAGDHDQEPMKNVPDDAPTPEIEPEPPRTSPPTTHIKQEHTTKHQISDKHATVTKLEHTQDDQKEIQTKSDASDTHAYSPGATAEENERIAAENEEDRKLEQDVNNIIDLVIEALVFSKKSSLSIPDIYTSIIGTNPTVYKTKGDKETWLRVIQKALDTNRFFRTLARTVSPRTETPPTTHHKGPYEQFNYYYDYSLDPVEWRQSAYADVGRTARRCTVARGSYEERPLHEPPFKRSRRR